MIVFTIALFANIILMIILIRTARTPSTASSSSSSSSSSSNRQPSQPYPYSDESDPLRVGPPRYPRMPVSPLYDPNSGPFVPPFGVGGNDLYPSGPG